MEGPDIAFAIGMALLTAGLLLVMFCAPSDWKHAGEGVIAGIVLFAASIVVLTLTATGAVGPPPDLSGVIVPGAP